MSGPAMVSIPRDWSGRWAPQIEDHHDLLSDIATAWRPTSQDAHENFLAACKADADAHAGYVSVNRVRTMLEGAGLDPHQFSALWSHYTDREGVPSGRPMVRANGRFEFCKGSGSRNNGKPYPLRRWVG
jgi:hypothetical protein